MLLVQQVNQKDQEIQKLRTSLEIANQERDRLMLLVKNLIGQTPEYASSQTPLKQEGKRKKQGEKSPEQIIKKQPKKNHFSNKKGSLPCDDLPPFPQASDANEYQSLRDNERVQGLQNLRKGYSEVTLRKARGHILASSEVKVLTHDGSTQTEQETRLGLGTTGEPWPSTTGNTSRTPKQGWKVRTQPPQGLRETWGGSQKLDSMRQERVQNQDKKEKSEQLEEMGVRLTRVLKKYDSTVRGLKSKVEYLERENKQLRRKLQQRSMSKIKYL